MEKPTDSELNPNDMSDTPEEDHHELGGSGASQSVTARSYECTFCKRGFSNAQALGGHMNIHRKDKAKLIKQPTFSIHQTNQQKLEVNRASDHGNIATSTRWPNRFLNKEGSTEHDDHQDYKDQKAAGLDDHQVHGESGKDLSSPPAGRSSPESEILDLELRLGPQPPQDSSSSLNMATRKFF